MRRAFTLPCLLLPACFSSLLSEENIACDSTLSCPTDFVCSPLTSTCVRGVERGCSRHQDCPFAQVCDDGACVEGCVETGDCGLDRDCINGACAPKGACTTSAVCAFGELCDATTGRCVKPTESAALCNTCEEHRCLEDPDCGPGSVCVRPDLNSYGVCSTCGGGECRTEATDTPCNADAQCAPGEGCIRYECNLGATTLCEPNGLGTCTGPSLPNWPALDGVGTCSLGLCGRRYCVNKGCAPPGSSEPGFLCPRGYECLTIVARPSTGECERDADCGGARCRRLNEAEPTRYCSCGGPGDCPAGSSCVDGSCVVETQCFPAVGLLCEDVRP